MKKSILISMFIFAIAFSSFAQWALPAFNGDSMATMPMRTKTLMYSSASIPPYAWVIPVTLTDTNYTVPDSIFCCGIYAARYTNVKVQFLGSDTMTIPIDSLDGLPCAVKKIWKHGTDSLSRNKKLFLVGQVRTKPATYK